MKNVFLNEERTTACFGLITQIVSKCFDSSAVPCIERWFPPRQLIPIGNWVLMLPLLRIAEFMMRLAERFGRNGHLSFEEHIEVGRIFKTEAVADF